MASSYCYMSEAVGILELLMVMAVVGATLIDRLLILLGGYIFMAAVGLSIFIRLSSAGPWSSLY